MNKLLVLCGILFFSGIAYAQKVPYARIDSVKKHFEKAYRITNTVQTVKVIHEDGDTLAYLFNYPRAFLVLSAREELPPVKAFSSENAFSFRTYTDGFNTEEFIKKDLQLFMSNASKNSQQIEKNRQSWQRCAKENTFEESKSQYGPYLPSLFGQVNCKDENNRTINVSNYYTPNHYAPGCVAITFTELLHYFKWPLHGMGSHSYTDNYGSSTGTYSANFDTYYKWNTIKDHYYKVASSDAERQALGQLVYHCAVAVNMDYEYNGSTSNVNRIPNAANKYFRYTASYINSSISSFWTQVDSNIINAYPVQFPVYSSGGAGHAVVGDGYQELSSQKLYHLNMGWWGSSNGWYDLQGSWNAGGYTIITGAVVEMTPVPEMSTPTIDVDKSVVKVQWYNTQTVAPQAYELQVKKGPAAWTTVDNKLTKTYYDYAYSSTEEYSFRVRAKSFNQWKSNAWSNIESIDIEKAIAQATKQELKVYPTVVTRGFVMEYGLQDHVVVALYHVNGHRVFYREIEGEQTPGKVQISMAGMQSGLYLLRIISPEETKIIKIIKL